MAYGTLDNELRSRAKFAKTVLVEGGWFITKVFDGAMMNQYRQELETHFKKIKQVLVSLLRSQEACFAPLGLCAPSSVSLQSFLIPSVRSLQLSLECC